jgi:hypothetical protein
MKASRSLFGLPRALTTAVPIGAPAPQATVFERIRLDNQKGLEFRGRPSGTFS